ncbi:MAG: potassium-transporting ATPase subunit KdpA [Alphaproteobacteria bacterium]|nr:potassium-transporting ATPase subunit KdpA [Alphaproteobacteria bacterium]
MTANALLQLIVFAAVTLALAVPCAIYITHIFTRQPMAGDVVLGTIERFFAAVAGPHLAHEQSWRAYAFSVMFFNLMGGALLYGILLFQNYLPWNPQNLAGLSPDLAFNIACSFVTNTNWQSYGGETTLSYFSQMAGLTVENYLSAATGIAVSFAVVRGFIRKESLTLGNFYADVTRITLYIFIPMSIIFALFLIWQGVPQNMSAYTQATTLEGAQQIIAQGPVASQIAIKMLGSNGGGFFNANGAHPFENPTPLSNFAEMVSILLLPVALVLAFGRMVNDKRQGRSLFICMTGLFVILLGIAWAFEASTHPALSALGIDQNVTDINSGGNMEGKETRFGIFNSVLWSVATSATSNGSVNSMLDSYMPLGGLVPLFNLLVGEVIYGGVGCGLYGILVYVLITVFIAGLMVGRTPEYLGKKIEAREIQFAMVAMFLYPVCVLGFGMLGLLTPAGAKSVTATGPHALTQAIYAYASAAANNGSAFGGFNANTLYQNVMLGFVMLLGRYGVILPVLAIAGSLASKKTVPASGGTFPTDGFMFIILLAGVIVMFGGLTYFPVFALGPIAEHLSLFGG